MKMAKCWSTVSLCSCFVTFLIEWKVFERIKIFLFGECFSTMLLISYSDTLYAFPPEVGLFGTDVTTDWVNGVNLIIDGHVIWGTLMVAL